MSTELTSFAAAAQPTELLFIDSRVPDLQAIIAAARPGVKVVILDPDENGVAQMARALEGEQGLASISVVSHGDEGMLLLGNGPLFGGNLQEYQAQLQAIGAALGPDGDLLLYGCDVGAGDAGAEFLQALAQITGADVAASDDSTAGAVRGGDWDLEITTGQIEAAPVLDAQSLQGYDASLLTVSVSSVAQLQAAITAGNTDGLNDLITLTGNISFATAADTISINVTDSQTMTIVGGGYTLSGGYLARVLNVGATPDTSAVVIQNLVITQGLVAGTGGDGGQAAGAAMGGGIYNAGKLTLDSVTVTNNAASGGGGGGGVAGAYAGGGGGGGGGIGGQDGGEGGTSGAGLYAGTAGSANTGGNGGGFDVDYMGGRGGSSVGGAGSIGTNSYSNGGAGGTANNGSISIGGGGGGSGWDNVGGAGGSASGGIYNAGTGSITVIG
ncbi:MAG: DUF4347 domain-containing protein, partial [Comamonas sp.]|uniref:DUF4347 domain-containing protein n=1 Tax=Comamonas sp. TaxID=34028 RepID=UPI002FCA0D54